ncbi:hypothetical protein KAW65_04090 [candidate division WOR-3 bacterium]|nr:hypothetical protein [candidate division WOR-3 bacterium]
MILYHYTDFVGYNGISSSGNLIPSTDTVVDATYGKGHYFTDLAPTACDKQIMKCCWQNTFMTYRIGYYIKLSIPEVYVKKCPREHVYLVPIGSITKFTLVDKGKKTECSLKPCEKCSLNLLYT